MVDGMVIMVLGELKKKKNLYCEIDYFYFLYNFF